MSSFISHIKCQSGWINYHFYVRTLYNLLLFHTTNETRAYFVYRVLGIFFLVSVSSFVDFYPNTFIFSYECKYRDIILYGRSSSFGILCLLWNCWKFDWFFGHTIHCLFSWIIFVRSWPLSWPHYPMDFFYHGCYFFLNETVGYQ